jgi:hypothetical protein
MCIDVIGRGILWFASPAVLASGRGYVSEQLAKHQVTKYLAS